MPAEVRAFVARVGGADVHGVRAAARVTGAAETLAALRFVIVGTFTFDGSILLYRQWYRIVCH